MVLKPDPIFECVESLGMAPREHRAVDRESVVLLSAAGRRFTQEVARELAHLERIVFLCGRYEGVDERVVEHLADRELSVGDFVLSGGEIGAALVIDAITRLLPGALGNEASSQQESFSHSIVAERASDGRPAPSSTCGSGGLLDYPHYTRPAEYRGWPVPEVLCSGNHEEIRRWRRRKALEKTVKNRPDLLQGSDLSKEDREFLAEIRREQQGDISEKA